MDPILSIVIPVYNEQDTLSQLIDRVLAVEYPCSFEIILVDDGSTDDTPKILKSLQRKPALKVIYFSENRGKGYAVREGFKASRGQVITIQDADLEYDPKDLPQVIKPILDGECDIVYGDRFSRGENNWSIPHHYLGNLFLSTVTSILFGVRVHDMETCYKAFKKSLLDDLVLQSTGFEIEVELTAKLLKKKKRFCERHISFKPRDFVQGKKITWRDGVKALYYLIKYRFTS